MSSRSHLRVYTVSFYNGEELMAGVYEDLAKAKEKLETWMTDLINEDPPGREYQELVDEVVLGEWQGEPLAFIGKSGICSLHCTYTALQLG